MLSNYMGGDSKRANRSGGTLSDRCNGVKPIVKGVRMEGFRSRDAFFIVWGMILFFIVVLFVKVSVGHGPKIEGGATDDRLIELRIEEKRLQIELLKMQGVQDESLKI